MRTKTKKLVGIGLACVMAVSITACGQKTQAEPETTVETESTTEAEKTEVTFDEIKGIVSGISDIKVWDVEVIVKDADAKAEAEKTETAEVKSTDNSKLVEAIRDRISVDATVIHGVDVDAEAVNLGKIGTYEVNYTVTAHKDALDKYLAEAETAEIDVALTPLPQVDGTAIAETDCDEDVVIQVSYKCEVLDKEGVKKAIEGGEKNILGAIENGKVTEAWKAVETKVEETEETKEEETPEVPEEVKPEEKPAEKLDRETCETC